MGTDIDAPTDADSVTDCQLAILDAVQRGHRYVADVLDYCGPRFEEEDRGFDSAAYTIEIEELVEGDYLRRRNSRLLGQLALDLTEKGREAAPALSDADRELLDAHDVTTDELDVLDQVVQVESETDALPSITKLQEELDSERSAYQYSLLFSSLVDAGLAEERGLLRYRVSPTVDGRELVELDGEYR